MLQQEKKHLQLELFEENLPYKPYCTDEKGFLRIRPKAIAKLKNYIQHNEPSKIRWLVYDCDYSGALEFVGDNQLPPPNFAVFNKVNGHSHLFYGLEVPVCITENGRAKPKEFLRKISYVLGETLKADQGYTNFISKNPLKNKFWEVFEVRESSWGLNEFLEYIDIPLNLPKIYKLVGVGRNVTVFNSVRLWSYKQVLVYRLRGTKTAFQNAVYGQCQVINATFPTPLELSELKTISKSISNWTWEKYTKRWTDEKFSEIQTIRGRRGGLKAGRGRSPESQEKRLQARSMRSEGATIGKISEALEVPFSTVGRWVKT